MLTTKANPHTHTIHIVGRDGVTALCRKNIKAYRFEGGAAAGQHLTYKVKGDDFGRSWDRNASNCHGCRAKLNKLVAEAWDAAHLEQDSRDAGPRTKAFTEALTVVDRITPAQRRALLASVTMQGVRVLDGTTRLGTVLALRDRWKLVDTTTHRFDFQPTRRYSRLSPAGLMALAILRHGADQVREWVKTQDAEYAEIIARNSAN